MMKFRVVQGSSDFFQQELGRVDVLLKALAEVYHISESTVPVSIAAEVVDSLITIHNMLQRMTGIGTELVKRDRPVNYAGDLIRNTYFADELIFIRGAVRDPFLYAGDPSEDFVGFQQGAVLNLRKAQYLLFERITNL